MFDVHIDQLGRIEPPEAVRHQHQRLIDLMRETREPVADGVAALNAGHRRRFLNALRDFNRLRPYVSEQNTDLLERINDRLGVDR